MATATSSANETSDKEFTLDKYLDKLEKYIHSSLSRPKKEKYTYDILDTEKSIQHRSFILAKKQQQMKIGNIWQFALGNYKGFEDLKKGHKTGLDILSVPLKIAMELKNRTNTDNASSKKSNLDKLAMFKKKNPEYICIYALINEDTKEKTWKGRSIRFKHNGVELEQKTGYELLTFILGEDTNTIIDFIKNTIDKYT